ncbi:MAG TPA: hypothetical protein VMP12_06290 [Candidatus Sulfotelmatobacter sp.]|nr:hypothetical protein [Candidatus Sulfotelmatobacter sp.]
MPERLPAVSAIASVSTTISAATTTASVSAATTTASAVSAATAAITATTAAASTTAATAFGLRSRFVHHQVASAEILTVQPIDRTFRIVIVAQLNECKPTRLAREAIPNQIDTRGTDTDL